VDLSDADSDKWRALLIAVLNLGVAGFEILQRCWPFKISETLCHVKRFDS